MKIEVHSVVHKDSLDVMFQGYLFRLVLVADSESEFEASGGDLALKADFCSDAVNNHVVLPLHHIAIKGVQRNQFPSFSSRECLHFGWRTTTSLAGLRPTTLFAPASSLAGFHRLLVRLTPLTGTGTGPQFDRAAITMSDKIDILARPRGDGKEGGDEGRNCLCTCVCFKVRNFSE